MKQFLFCTNVCHYFNIKIKNMALIKLQILKHSNLCFNIKYDKLLKHSEVHSFIS